MKIGLVRHFRVKQDYPKRLVSAEEVMKWFNEYENAEVEDGETDLLGIEWQSCFTSNLHRAALTADKIFKGSIVRTEQLREVPNPILSSKLRLPFILWAVYIRLSWITDPKIRVQRKQAESNLKQFLDEVVHRQEDVLIVSHGAVMMLISKILKKRGFHGPKLGNPQNGKLYIFENN